MLLGLMLREEQQGRPCGISVVRGILHDIHTGLDCWWCLLLGFYLSVGRRREVSWVRMSLSSECSVSNNFVLVRSSCAFKRK